MSNQRLLSSSSVCSDPVVNLQGEKLGEIEDLMIDLHSGKIEYAVLSCGGFLGLGEKYFAVPWGAMALDRGEHELVLDVDKDYLSKAPGFDKDDWPDFASPSFRERHYSYWEVKQATR